MAEIDLYGALKLWNEHWESGAVSGLIQRNARTRRAYEPQRERIWKLPFQVIAGPRQVGKTTLLGHLIQDLLDRGHPARNILYVPLDIPGIALESGGRLDPVLRAYERFVLETPLRSAKQLVFVFLDEIHTLGDWSRELKALHDQYHPVLRVVATGSSSAALTNPPTADLPGRVENVRIYPLKFSETLEGLHPDRFPPGDASLPKKARATRALLGEFDGTSATRTKLATGLEALYRDAASDLQRLHLAFERYLLRGGYPAAVAATTMQEAFKFFQATTDMVFSTDLKLLPKIRKPASFQSFLALLARDHGGKFNAKRFANDLDLDKETPAQWKAIAEDLFIAHQLPQLNPSFRPLPRKSDKAFIQDPGLRSFLATTSALDELERTGKIGDVVEGVLFDHLRRMQFNLHGHRNATMGYWAEPEVDFLVQLPRAWLGVESKYSGSPKASPGIMRLAEKRRDVLAILATKDKFDVESNPICMPAWMLAIVS